MRVPCQGSLVISILLSPLLSIRAPCVSNSRIPTPPKTQPKRPGKSQKKTEPPSTQNRTDQVTPPLLPRRPPIGWSFASWPGLNQDRASFKKKSLKVWYSKAQKINLWPSTACVLSKRKKEIRIIRDPKTKRYTCMVRLQEGRRGLLWLN